MALGAILVSLIPYRVQTDEKTGVVEIRSLLWAWRKTPPKEGEEKGNYIFSPFYILIMQQIAENRSNNLTPTNSYAILIATYRKGDLPMKQMMHNIPKRVAAMPVIVYSVIDNLYSGEV